MKKYKINEIFYSLQGEGMYTGFPVIFVRFSGCNRKCDFCDTEHEFGELYSRVEIIDEIAKLSKKCGHVVLTGGEPTLQVDRDLIDLLHEYDYIIHLETNGDFIPDYINKIDWVTVSPKDDEYILRQGNELKLVYIDQDLSKYEKDSFKYFFLQPCSMQNIEECIEKVKKNPLWCLSLQQQKILKIR